MTKGEAEDYLIKNANRGYPANKGDLDAQYSEEKYEMSANGMRAPSYGKWLEERVARTERAKARAETEATAGATPEGEKIIKAYRDSVDKSVEASKGETKARQLFEMAVREVSGGANLTQFRYTMADRLFQDGTRVGENKERQELYFKEKFPNEYKKLEDAIANREQADKERREAGDKQRNFLNGR
jgi:hypothetical protein